MMKCMSCCAERIVAEVKQNKGELPEDAHLPEIRDAITWAPAWQTQAVAGQMVMACVALPTCKEHIQAVELSPADQAVRGGRLLQGKLGGPNGVGS
jgi:hypothetical protein